MVARTTAAFALAFLVAIPVARAHDDVEAGVAAYQEANFEAALSAFGRAEASPALSREDLARMLFVRALVHSAFGSDGARDVDLLRLASLAPDHPLRAAGSDGTELVAPPPVREAFAAAERGLAGPIAIRVALEAAPGGAILRASVENDPGGLTRRVRVTATVGGAEQRADDGRVTLRGDAGAAVTYAASALGPGGAVLATREGEDAIPGAAALADAIAPAPEGGSDEWAWWLGGGIALAVLAGGIALVVVLVTESGGDEPGTQLAPPVFVRP